MDEHAASRQPADDTTAVVHEEVGELDDGRTVRYFGWGDSS